MAAILSTFFWFSRLDRPKRKQVAFEISYEMARPTKTIFNSELSLSDRELERRLHNPYRSTREDLQKETRSRAALPQRKGVARPIEIPRSKLATKKRRKKTSENLRIVEESESTSWGGFHTELENSTYPPSNFAQNEIRKALEKNSPNPLKPDDAQGRKDGVRDWKRLFKESPTMANMNLMIRAQSLGKVPADVYFDIVNDLLLSPKESERQVGFAGLKASNNFRGFVEGVELLSKEEIQRTQGLPQAIESYLMEFQNPNHKEALALALRAPQTEVVVRALQVLQSGIRRALIQPRSGDFQEGRAQDQGAQANYQELAMSYRSHDEALQALSQSPEPEISQAASQALNDLNQLPSRQLASSGE